MRTIGFAGTAKNTGKTTAASAFLTAAGAAGLCTALTSIGYDGEAIDTVTGLPKPRYVLHPGTLVATTDRCLAAGTARCEILGKTGIATILGEILLARVQETGQVLLAGPNRRIDVDRILQALIGFEVDLNLVDGALNRLVPLSAADGLVLSTGAALHRDPDQVARHAAALVRLFSLPVVLPEGEGKTIRWVDRFERQGSLSTGSLIGEEGYRALKEQIPDSLRQITIPGACDPAWLERLVEVRLTAFSGVEVVFDNPFHLVASGDPLRWQALLARLEQAGALTGVQSTVPLCCLTVNPFYPRYDPATGRYAPAFTDSQSLQNSVRAAVPRLPVVDVRRSDCFDFLDLLGINTKESNG